MMALAVLIPAAVLLILILGFGTWFASYTMSIRRQTLEQARAWQEAHYVVDVASLCAKPRYGYGYGDMRPIDSLADNAIPICFIHGAADEFIPPENSEAMRQATQGYGELHLIDGAGHAKSILKDPQAYRRIVEQFIGRIESDRA